MNFVFDDSDFIDKKQFSFDEILELKVEETQYISSLDIRDMFGDILLYGMKKEELLKLMPTNCADILLTDNPSVHNLNILKDILNFKSTILILDVAGMMLGDEETRIENFLQRHGYEFTRKGYIGDFTLYDYRKEVSKSYTDTFLKEITSDISSMCFINSLEYDCCLVVDTAVVADIIYHAGKIKKNVVALVEFKEENMKFIDNIENRVERQVIKEKEYEILW